MINIFIYPTGRVSSTRAIRKQGKVAVFNGGKPRQGETLEGYIKRCEKRDKVVITDLREAVKRQKTEN